MAKYPRITGKVFGRTADASGDDPQIGEFGSALTGQYNGTGDISVIQGNSAWDNGFISCVTPTNQYPPLPEMTGFGKVLSQQICYLLQQGVAEYDSATEYYTGNWCAYNGSLYVAKSDGFSNKLPTNTTYWSKFTGASSRNLGEIVTSSLPLTDGTLHLADGSLLSQQDYPEFTSYIANLYNSLPSGEFSLATQNSTLLGYDWRGIANNGNIVIAVSYEGYISKSTNGGQTWTSPSKKGLTITEYVAVTYGNGCFIAITVDGIVIKSTDNGENWSRVSNLSGSGGGTPSLWSSISYGKGKFIAVSDTKDFCISLDDGENWYLNLWTTYFSGSFSNAKRILFANNEFIVICKHTASPTEYNHSIIKSSTGGGDWTIQGIPNLGSYSYTYTILTSDGVNLFAITSDGYIAKGSLDGLNWENPIQNTNLGNNSWTSATCVIGNIIAISSTSYISSKEVPFTDVFTTEADWQTTYTTYGECGKYVYNSTNNTVRIPLYNTYLTNTVNPQKLGNLTPASIPNIKGIISANERLYKSGTSVADYGAFNNYAQNVVSGQSDNTNFDNDLWDFDASRVSSVYSDSATTVNTQSIKQLVYIVVAQ